MDRVSVPYNLSEDDTVRFGLDWFMNRDKTVRRQATSPSKGKYLEFSGDDIEEL